MKKNNCSNNFSSKISEEKRLNKMNRNYVINFKRSSFSQPVNPINMLIISTDYINKIAVSSNKFKNFKFKQKIIN